MTTNITIRQSTLSDQAAIKLVYLKMLQDTPDAFGVTLAEIENRDEAEWTKLSENFSNGIEKIAFLAETDGQIIGFVNGDTTDSRIPPETALVSQLWVENTYRKHGIGKNLMNKINDWAISRQLKRISLGVTATNIAVLEFYKNLGYVDTGMKLPLNSISDTKISILVKRL